MDEVSIAWALGSILCLLYAKRAEKYLGYRWATDNLPYFRPTHVPHRHNKAIAMVQPTCARSEIASSLVRADKMLNTIPLAWPTPRSRISRAFRTHITWTRYGSYCI